MSKAQKLTVFSTLGNDNRYGPYEPGGADLPSRNTTVLINGGAGVANDRIITPQGVATHITEEQEAILRADPVFILHEKNGFLKVSKRADDPDEVAKDMNPNDKGKPLLPADFKGGKDDPDAAKTNNQKG